MMVLIVKCFINVDFLGKFGWFIGYVVIFIGVGDNCNIFGKLFEFFWEISVNKVFDNWGYCFFEEGV